MESQRQIAHKAYGQAIHAMVWIIDNIKGPPIQVNETLALVLRAVNELLKANNQAILAMATSSTTKNYLYAHCVNEAIFSVLIGRGLGWDENEIQTLGLCALLQDIGMTSYVDLASQPRELPEPERERVRSHPLESQKLLTHLEDLDPNIRKWVSDVIGKEHEWKSGKTTSQRIGRAADIPTMAQILALCDLYEALTHPRSWRKGISPHEMIKDLLKKRRQEFDPVLIKIFVQAMSLFPPGCLVQLSTLEVGYVVAVREETPTRPTVELRVRSDGSAFSPTKLINLEENPTTHITAAIDESQVKIKDPELAKQLEAARWWTSAPPVT